MGYYWKPGYWPGPRFVENPTDDQTPWVVEAVRVFSSATPEGRELSAPSPELEAVILANTAPMFLARVVNGQGEIVDPAAVASGEYSIARVTPDDPLFEDPVPGHANVGLTLGEVWSTALRLDYRWGETDTRGYNFAFQPQISVQPAFPDRETFYRISFAITPVTGQVLLLRYLLRAV